MKRIYVDNAATTSISAGAKATMLQVMELGALNASSIHKAGREAKGILEDARTKIAQGIGAKPAEILFTSGGTESDNQAILTAAAAGRARGRMHIVTSAFEHHAVLHTMQKLEKQGYEVTWLTSEDGVITPEQVEAAVQEDTCLVSIMTANNEIGTIQPISRIGSICRDKGVLFHTDAVQAVGHIPVNVTEMNVDMLSASGHKFHGPQGTGFLYARRGVHPVRLLEGGAQERALRPGTENLAGIAGMAQAFAESVLSADAAEKTRAMRDYIMEELGGIPRSRLNGAIGTSDQGSDIRLPGNVSFCFEGIESESLLLLLDEKGICASAGSACSAGALDPSHVLLAMGYPMELARSTVRISLNEENTMDEAREVVQAVKESVAFLRASSPTWRDKMEGRQPFLLD